MPNVATQHTDKGSSKCHVKMSDKRPAKCVVSHSRERCLVLMGVQGRRGTKQVQVTKLQASSGQDWEEILKSGSLGMK